MIIVLQPMLIPTLLQEGLDADWIAFVPWNRSEFTAFIGRTAPEQWRTIARKLSLREIVCVPTDDLSDRKSWEVFSRFLADHDQAIPDWEYHMAADEYDDGFRCRYHPSIALAAMNYSGYYPDDLILCSSPNYAQ